MSDYKCIRSFRASSGNNYQYGATINSSTYNRLSFLDRNNFQEVSRPSSRDNHYSPPMDFGSDSGSSSSSSLDSGSSSSDSSSFDFGGGDSGGGGASGDW